MNGQNHTSKSARLSAKNCRAREISGCPDEYMNMTKKWNYQQHESKNFIMEKIVGIIWSTQLLLNTTVV